jgi:CRISPR system Cascade subunit CasA
MSRTFNLVDETWIPCITRDGTVKHEGILGTLTGAADYAEVRDSSPLVTVALHRLLLAILHRVFGPESPEAWAELWENGSGRFDANRLEEYLKRPSIYSRFDLFDEKHPFYQTASLPLGRPDTKTGRHKNEKPILQLAHELAYSDNLHIFEHYQETNWEARPTEEAARWLVAFQAFAHSNLVTTEEGKKKEHGSADAAHLVKSAVVLVQGDNLFQTLLLSMVHYSEEDEEPFPFKASRDKPAWERDDPVRPEDRPFDGYLDLLTWQSRRVRLVPEVGQPARLKTVSGVVTMRGWQLPGFLRYGRETMVGFLKAEKAAANKDPWPPLGFRLGRELWRDCHTLLQTVAEKSERPRILQWIDDLRQRNYLTRSQVQLDVIGMSSSTAKILFWRHESLPLPLAYLDKSELIESLKELLKLADRVVTVLNDAVWMAAVIAMKPDKKEARLSKTERDAIKRIVQSLGAEPLFWSRLEEPFRRRLAELPGDDSHRSRVIQRWFTDSLRPAARTAYRRTAGELEDSSRALRAAVSGEAFLDRGLDRMAADYKFNTDTAQKEKIYVATRP